MCLCLFIQDRMRRTCSNVAYKIIFCEANQPNKKQKERETVPIQSWKKHLEPKSSRKNNYLFYFNKLAVIFKVCTSDIFIEQYVYLWKWHQEEILRSSFRSHQSMPPPTDQKFWLELVCILEFLKLAFPFHVQGCLLDYHRSQMIEDCC